MANHTRSFPTAQSRETTNTRSNAATQTHGVALLPLVAVTLAASLNASAQTPTTTPSTPTTTPTSTDATAKTSEKSLKAVTVKEKAEVLEGRDAVRATTTTVGKGNQPLRDIPQSVTVVTEKLINDRNLDTVKDVLRNTAGVSFQAAEGGEEDVRLRGFSLATTGDIFLDGMRDAAFYDRDTFNFDRVDLLRGSASMLFGRGSTGGAVNQVSKEPSLNDERQATITIGNHNYRRVVAHMNQSVGDKNALLVSGMHTKADNNGAGSSIDKQGAAVAYRHGIGDTHEFKASLYHLENNNGMNYGLPWIRPNTTDTSAANTIISGLDPSNYYGMASDYNAGRATIATLNHLFRFGDDNELKTQIRRGEYKRDQHAGTVRFAGVGTTATTNRAAVDLSNFGPSTVLTRGTNLKLQDLDTVQAQSDLSAKFNTLGYKHHALAGVDYSRDERSVYGALNVAQGGTAPVKPTTLAGTPNDGATVDEFGRVPRTTNDFTATGFGAYVQDLIQVTPAWKAVGGLRYDNLDGRYNAYAIPNSAPSPVTTTSYQQRISAISYRAGVLFQPNELHSYHFSYGTSFNTSADTYSYNALSANTSPESSENWELGAKLDTADKRFTTRLALFYSVKKNERNTDPDTAATRLLLSGKRHTAGFEADFAGLLTSKWEIFGSYMWMPVARVDQAASTATTVGNRVGDRPGLSPKHSGTAWVTYQVDPKLRVGGGLNFRSGQSPADVTAPAWQVPGFVTADLLAEYVFSPKYKLKANVSNVANKLYAESLYRGHYIPGAGRLYQLALTVNF
jgi:catecholate siderophore receptor